MTPNARRKQRQRDKDAELGIERTEIKLSKNEREQLAFICEFRGGYDKDECIRALIRNEYKRTQKLKKKLGKCAFCGEQLPTGCNKNFKGHGECFYTTEAREKLSL